MLLIFILINICYSNAITYNKYKYKFINTTNIKNDITLEICKEICNKYEYCKSLSYKYKLCFISNTSNLIYSIEDKNSTLYIKNKTIINGTDNEKNLFWILITIFFLIFSCLISLYGRDLCRIKCSKKRYEVL